MIDMPSSINHCTDRLNSHAPSGKFEAGEAFSHSGFVPTAEHPHLTRLGKSDVFDLITRRGVQIVDDADRAVPRRRQRVDGLIQRWRWGLADKNTHWYSERENTVLVGRVEVLGY